MSDKTDRIASQVEGEEGGAEEECTGKGEEKGNLAKKVTGAGSKRHLHGEGMAKPFLLPRNPQAPPAEPGYALARCAASSPSIFPALGGPGTEWQAMYSPRDF